MTRSFAHSGERLAIYAGEFIERLSGGLPDGSVIVGGGEAAPSRLAAAMSEAAALVVLDPHSFPVEAVDHRDVPLVVWVPPGSDAGELADGSGGKLFRHLGFYDRVATPDPGLWQDLRDRYGWAKGQWIRPASDDPAEALEKVCAGFESEAPDLRSGKAVHRVQAAALEPQFAGALVGREAPAVLEVGAGDGRWAASFDPSKVRYTGIETEEDLLEAARSNFPERRFVRPGSGLRFPCDPGSFDLAFAVDAMSRHSTEAKRTLVSEMWRVTTPGGRLLFLEDFVSSRRATGTPSLTVTEFEDLVLAATSGRVVLEHVEAIKYLGDEIFRGGLISLMKL
jgi:SAM-dependent methyltransferase